MRVIYSSYIPPVIKKNKEFQVLDVILSEYFEKIWDVYDREFLNQRIATADEEGIRYFEKLCGIIPKDTDTIEFRRAMVEVKWNERLPYNYEALINKLDAICGEDGFTAVLDFDKYELNLTTHIKDFDQMDRIENVIDTIVPCNLKVTFVNSAILDGTQELKFGSVGSIGVRIHAGTKKE